MIPAPALPPIDAGELLSRWSLSPFATTGCVLALGWYLVAARRAAARGTPVPAGRIAAFTGGVVAVFLALASSIDVYAEVSFTVHMVQHLLLTFVAPPLLAMGAPVALALRASSPPTARRITRLLGSATVRGATNPLVGFVVFATLPFVLHLTPVYDAALRDPWVHALEHAVLLASGLLYWWPLVEGDPMPGRPGHAARVVSLFLLLPAQTFLALVLFSADAPLYEGYATAPAPFGRDALSDQRTAAALMWVVGGAFVIGAAVASAATWRRDEETRQVRIERLEDAAGRGGAPFRP